MNMSKAETVSLSQNLKDELEAFGIDAQLLECNLNLSPGDRLKMHQSALDLVWALENCQSD